MRGIHPVRALSNLALVPALVAMVAISTGPPEVGTAASHREAPLIAMDPEADITDTFMFRSYEGGHGDNVVMVMDVIPGEEPSSGPNYYNFDPRVRYAFNVDNNADGKAEDVVFEFAFRTELRGVVDALGLPLSYVALPPITALDGPGSEGLGLRQRYSVTMIRNGKRTVLGDNLIAVPSNVGPRTTPNYDALAQQGIYSLGGGVRVFAGQRDDPFYIDLGATFDTLNFRRTPPFLTAAEDANDNANPFGTDMLSGFNVHTIALEVPSAMLTKDGKSGTTTSQATIGMYANTSRQAVRVLRRPAGSAFTESDSGPWVQVQRLANPLVNEVIIGTEDKDRWNATEPEDEAQFLNYYLKPRFALALQTVFGANTGCTPFGGSTCAPNPPAAAADLQLSNFNRTDLVNILLKYSPTDKQLSELLRLNLNSPITPFGSQNRLTVLAGDNAGWPNGRRPKDDVTDVAVRVVGGPNYINARAGDGVNTNDKPLPGAFPFLASPWDGRNRVHQNP